eukprot:CAMPEP_0178375254 /NCGR_PEP_ID=MMETSP0689_2-20121128/2791_1 /TAXON_ID=160604 /ORGANISM="Amphidinium massartii, Strain CS-259" /LENGTH=1610 /DNA_ID=CAMNT_0019995237 /DNA_START=1 /DNA_END=4829 /DNA_ORIENTATION=+
MALATYDAKLAKIEQEKALEKQRGPRNRDVEIYTGPRVKWEDTGLYKAMMKKETIEEELTRIRNLIRKRTDPNYEPDDDDFKVAPTRKFDSAQDYYKLLDVDDFATVKDIKGSYKRMALLYHPDKNRDKSPDELRKMQDEFEKIQEAYEVLSDRATRRQYDRQRYDEKRAKNQGMGGIWKDKEADKKDNYWSTWSAQKAERLSKAAEKGAVKIGSGTKLPKCPDVVVEVRISLNKSLRGGMKILQVKRARVQRSTGGAPEAEKTYHVPIAPGQAQDSEVRLDGEGAWSSITYLPGDLVFKFKHKPHPYLRQVADPAEGNVAVSTPLTVRAKVTDQALAVWTPTFKGQMVLLRFLNPLGELAPSKMVSLTMRLPGEGLPIASSSSQRGVLSADVMVHLDGETFMPTLGSTPCLEALRRRVVRSYNRQPALRLDLVRVRGTAGAPVRQYVCTFATDRSSSHRVGIAAVAMVWEAEPSVDPVLFAKAAAALGWHASNQSEGFLWGFHRGLLQSALPETRHEWLADHELESDSGDEQEVVAESQAAVENESMVDTRGMPETSCAEGGGDHKDAPVNAPETVQSAGDAFGFDFDDLEEVEEAKKEPVTPRSGATTISASAQLEEEIASSRVQTAPAHRKTRRRPDVEDFLLKFNLGPFDGFPEPPSEDEDPHVPASSSDAVPDAPKTEPFKSVSGRSHPTRPAPPVAVCSSVPLAADEQEGEEEKELTALIRQRSIELEQAKRKFTQRKQRLQSERDEEESELRTLLERDKAREMERIEKEMSGLRTQFESQVKAEDKWRAQFNDKHRYDNEWVVVFKPAMAVRRTPKEEAQIVRKLNFNDVVKAKTDKPNEEMWIQLGPDQWALTWHQKHGQLMQKWYGNAQSEYLELEKKIADRRQTRNQTFIDYKRKKKEVTEWTIPEGPSEEEKKEIADEEGEQLSGILAPILQDLKTHKRRLRDLRQKRYEAALARAQKGSGSLTSGQLPSGFQLEDAAKKDAGAGAGAESEAHATEARHVAWEALKQSADEAFKQRDWHRACSLYSQALEEGGKSLDSKHVATLLSNRSLVQGKLDDWQRSLEDAKDATITEPEWVKGWLRRAAAEIRLARTKDALDSLLRGVSCPNASSLGQFLPLIQEVEAALYEDHNDGSEAPTSASERIQAFRTRGSQAFEQGAWGRAILFYTRALYHRAMMDPANHEEARIVSNRSAAFLKLNLAKEALADALAASELDKSWSKPCVRAAQAALLLQDITTAYTQFAKARRLEEASPAANEGVSSTLKMIMSWEYPAAARRWQRFSIDRSRAREGLRIWTLSDLHFDQHGAPEWCKSLSSSFFRDDILMLAGNVADSLEKLKFGLTVLKSKFRRVFFVPGNQDLWVKAYTLGDIIKGREKVANEAKTIGDSMSKFLQVMQVCDDLGIDVAPAEVAGGVFIVPLMSWYSREFVSREMRRNNAAQSDADQRVTIDQWIRWPFPCGSDDAWKFFMRMNEPILRAALVAKSAFEGLAGQQATVLTMTHFLTRAELPFDWSVPGLWDYIGCDGLDEQARILGSDVHVYGHACTGGPCTHMEGVHYVHNYLGTPDKHRPGMAPFCVYDRGSVAPTTQPVQEQGFNFQPTP